MPTFPKRKSALPRPLAETMLLPCRRSLRRFALLSVGLLCVTIGYAALVYVRETVLRDVRGVRVDRAWDTVLAKTLEDGVVGLKPSTEQACVHPVLDLWHPELRGHFKPAKPLKCASENWVFVENGTFRIAQSAVSKYGKITCSYTPQLRGTNDFTVLNGATVQDMQDGARLRSDFFMAHCKAADGAVYKNLHSGVHHKPEFHNRHNIFPLGTNSMGLNVLMFGFDSVSRMTWLRNLPKSHRYFTETLGGTVLEGYNIVGDGTPQALLPILTGKTEPELGEARRGHKGAQPVDGHPWIWREMRKQGYVTQWGEDGSGFGTFTYRMLGFTYQPVDHYMRPFYIQAEKQYSSHPAYCLGSVPRHVNMLHYIRDLFEMYSSPRSRKFSFLFHSEYTHGGYSQLQVVDDDLLEFLKLFEQRGYLNNTMLILMSDHGARFHAVRQTVQGKYEERMPYFSFRFPPWFPRKYPKAYKNFMANSKKLTTPFDIHETFVDMLNYTSEEPKDIQKQRGISLFKEIPNSRTCESAGVEMHWCACLNWKDADPSSSHVISAARQLVDTLNRITADQRQNCEELKLDKVIRAGVYAPNSDLLKFKQSSDHDGRKADLSDTMKASEIFYQLTIITSPNHGQYEATLKFVARTSSFVTNEHEISRTNKYGDQPHCVRDSLPHLRPYCYCKSQLS